MPTLAPFGSSHSASPLDKIFHVSRAAISASELIRGLLDGLFSHATLQSQRSPFQSPITKRSPSPSTASTPPTWYVFFTFRLSISSSPCQSYVIKWIEFHHTYAALDVGDPKILQFRETFWVTCDQETMFGILILADQLMIASLVDSGCQIVADMAKGKTPEQLRLLFNIQSDFQPEEEERLRRDFFWSSV
jgi:hypothetical protein